MNEPILFLVSRGLLEHKPRMGAAIWEYLWFIDRVTKDEPSGDGKYNGVVLGGVPVSATTIAGDLHEHLNTAKANIKLLESEGYILRQRRLDNRCSYVVTNSKKWFWNRISSKDKTSTENCASNSPTHTENCASTGQKTVRASPKNCTSNKERHDIDTTIKPKPKTTTPSASKPSESKRGTRIPETFSVTEEHREFAHKCELPSPDEHIAEFCDYWRAKPGKDGLKLDWNATFRNWLRKAGQFSRGKAKGGNSSPSFDGIDYRKGLKPHPDGGYYL